MLVNLKENIKIKTAKIENRMKLKKKCNKTKQTNVFKNELWNEFFYTKTYANKIEFWKSW